MKHGGYPNELCGGKQIIFSEIQVRPSRECANREPVSGSDMDRKVIIAP